ncbi:hypothetical protein PG989_000739 [Apiospora arundinis]
MSYPDPIHRHCYRCSNFASGAQNAPLAESEGGRLRCFWRFIVYTTAAWSPAIRARVYAPHSAMKWYLLELAFYGTGVSLYAFRIPERFVPGKFDIWGSSHQIFHLAILCAMYTHLAALLQGFTTCHTLEVCQPQSAPSSELKCYRRTDHPPTLS